MKVLSAGTVIVALLLSILTISTILRKDDLRTEWASCNPNTGAKTLKLRTTVDHGTVGISSRNGNPQDGHDADDLPVVNYSAVWMPPSEIDVLLPYLRNVDTYLEWGSGGSTLNFAPFARRVAHSIEHDFNWCGTLRDQLSRHAKCDRVQYHCVRVRRGHRYWGLISRFDEGTYFQFDVYVDKVDDLGEPLFDFVLIDGRARVAAAVKSLAYISPQSRVVLHDASRIEKRTFHHPKYDAIKTYYDFEELVVGEGCPGIVVMRRKPEWDFLQGNLSAVNSLLRARPAR